VNYNIKEEFLFYLDKKEKIDIKYLLFKINNLIKIILLFQYNSILLFQYNSILLNLLKI
jgi:hypothetical protein